MCSSSECSHDLFSNGQEVWIWIVLCSLARYTQALTNSKCHYGLIDHDHWYQPDWYVPSPIPKSTPTHQHLWAHTGSMNKKRPNQGKKWSERRSSMDIVCLIGICVDITLGWVSYGFTILAISWLMIACWFVLCGEDSFSLDIRCWRIMIIIGGSSGSCDPYAQFCCSVLLISNGSAVWQTRRQVLLWY